MGLAIFVMENFNKTVLDSDSLGGTVDLMMIFLWFFMIDFFLGGGIGGLEGYHQCAVYIENLVLTSNLPTMGHQYT